MQFPRRTYLTLAAALAVALTALPARAADAVKYLPDDTQAVVSLNVRQFLDSPLVKKANLDKALERDVEAQKVLKDLGLNPLKDVERVLFARGPSEEDSAIIFQGTFDPAKLHAKAEAALKEKKDYLKIHKGDNGTFYEVVKLDELIPVPPQAQGAGVNFKGKSVFVAIADKNDIVVSGSKAVAGEALDRAAGKKEGKLKSKDLAALVAKINPQQTLAVAVPGSVTQTEKIKSITGGLTVASDVQIDLAVAAADADAAKEIDDTIKEQLGMAQGIVGAIAAGNKALAPVADILDAIKPEAKDKAVLIKGTVKGATLEKLFKGLAEMAGKGGI
jgi:hypothetical protein